MATRCRVTARASLVDTQRRTRRVAGAGVAERGRDRARRCRARRAGSPAWSTPCGSRSARPRPAGPAGRRGLPPAGARPATAAARHPPSAGAGRRPLPRHELGAGAGRRPSRSSARCSSPPPIGPTSTSSQTSRRSALWPALGVPPQPALVAAGVPVRWARPEPRAPLVRQPACASTGAGCARCVGVVVGPAATPIARAQLRLPGADAPAWTGPRRRVRPPRRPGLDRTPVPLTVIGPRRHPDHRRDCAPRPSDPLTIVFDPEE